MKIIRDTIHGDIILEDYEIEIIDTKEFQRLRRIKQLGLTYLTYPSANHTRFEHSLGTMYISDRICKRLGLDNDTIKHVRISALLHDLGHCPLSHTGEEVLIRYFGKKHEELTIRKIESSEIKDLLKKFYDYDRVIKILSGKDSLSVLISSYIDCDRLDYILRDSYHTGVAYGIIDLSRIINNVEMFKDEIVFNVKCVPAIEGFLIARYLMNSSVYYHHATRIAERMLLKAIEINIEEKRITLDELLVMDDIDLFSFLRRSNNHARILMEFIDSRKLYKRALVYYYKELDKDFVERFLRIRNDYKLWKKIEREIAEDLNLEDYEILLDIPRLIDEKVTIKIRKENEILDIHDISMIPKVLDESMKGIWFVSLYTKREYVDKVKRVNIFEYLS